MAVAPELHTERLTLGALQPADAADLYRYRSLPAVGAYQSWVPESEAEAASFIQQQSQVLFDTPDSWYQLAIRLRDTAVLVGDLGIHVLADARQVEIGFTIDPAQQRRGLATEAVQALLLLLFARGRKHRVTASVDPRNAASIALLQKLGFRQEAYFRQSYWWRGEWADDVVFALLQSDWEAQAEVHAA